MELNAHISITLHFNDGIGAAYIPLMFECKPFLLQATQSYFIFFT